MHAMNIHLEQNGAKNRSFLVTAGTLQGSESQSRAKQPAEAKA